MASISRLMSASVISSHGASGSRHSKQTFFLASLHGGGTAEEALLAAEIDPSTVSSELLSKVARAIGVALGRIASAL